MLGQQNSDRAVSTVVGYVLALSISTVLIGGLIVGSTTFLRNQQERVADETLGVVGEQIALAVSSVDAPPNENGNETVVIDLPEEVAGQQYEIAIRNAGSPSSETLQHDITLSTDSPPAKVTVPVTTSSDIVSETGQDSFKINGGDVRIERNGSGELVIKNA